MVRLLDADACAIFRFDGDEIVMVGGRAAPGHSMFVRGTRFAIPDSAASREVLRTGAPVHLASYTRMGGEGPRRVAELGFQTLIGAPVFVEGRMWGTLTAASSEPGRLPERSAQQLDVLARVTAVTIALGENMAQLESQSAEQRALLRVSQKVLELAETETVLRAIAEEAARLLGLTRGAVFRFEDEGVKRLAAGWDADGLPEGAARADDLADLVRARDAAVNVGDPDATASAAEHTALGLQVGWGAPIRIEGRLWGALVVAGGGGVPAPQDAGERLARFAGLCGLAVARVEARDALVRQLVETEQFAALVELSDDFIAIADLEGNCLYVNRGGRRLLGIDSLEEARAHAIPDFLTPEGVTASIELEQPAVIAQGSWQGESSLKHFKTGESIPVSINSFLVTHPVTNAPLVLATVQRDLRERKRAEEELRAQAEEVEQLARARRFLLVEALRAEERLRRTIGDSLHDNVLQELLAARQDLAEAGPEASERARAAVDAASRQLRDIVHNLHPAVSWTRDLEERVRSILEQGAERGGFEWSLDFKAGDLGDGDDLVLAVIRELTQNVIKHAEASRVTLVVYDDGDDVCLELADDGRGMPAERPWEALREGHIGLASARERIDALGGEFELHTAPGQGTRLRVTVPRAGIAELPGHGHVE